MSERILRRTILALAAAIAVAPLAPAASIGRPLRLAVAPGRSFEVPILMYHRVDFVTASTPAMTRDSRSRRPTSRDRWPG